mmetsp:Transcript_19041/g.34439  ORF Transcript_19041/g.34439 Transcript_19041/m.34439 type:complete len:207 (-) Transcript_19041:844-1464(-)
MGKIACCKSLQSLACNRVKETRRSRPSLPASALLFQRKKYAANTEDATPACICVHNRPRVEDRRRRSALQQAAARQLLRCLAQAVKHNRASAQSGASTSNIWCCCKCARLRSSFHFRQPRKVSNNNCLLCLRKVAFSTRSHTSTFCPDTSTGRCVAWLPAMRQAANAYRKTMKDKCWLLLATICAATDTVVSRHASRDLPCMDEAT